MDCNRVQEMVARGECVGPAERAHAAVCAACSAVVESWGQLDALLQDDPAVTVPQGFADRVMAAIADQPGTVAPLRWFERRAIRRRAKAQFKSFRRASTHSPRLGDMAERKKYVSKSFGGGAFGPSGGGSTEMPTQ